MPIILNIISDSKESSNKRSIELYGKAIENAVGQYQVKNPQDSDITLEDVQPYITYKGNKVECTTKINKDGTVYLSECKVAGKDVDYTYGEDKSSTDVPTTPSEPTETIGRAATEENKTLAGVVPTGNFDPGDEYIINVDGTHEYHFYVLSTEGDKVNLILSGNICSDGTLATETNTCLVPWISDEDYDYYPLSIESNTGPITAMNYLYEATKNWNNIENINMNYTDEGNNYGGITTSGNITTITDNYGNITVEYENLKARMIKHLEFTGVECYEDYSNGICIPPVVNGLSAIDELSGYKDDIEGIYGYWSLSSSSFVPSEALLVSYEALEGYNLIDIGDNFGVRPVIEVLKSDLS